MTAVALIFVFSACEPSDANKDYGFPLIYIPQATVTGLDNSYPIPTGPIAQNSTYSCRYNKENGRLEIALGVIRAGYIANAKGFSVTLGVDSELTDAKLAEYGAAAIALPTELCTIPDKISVKAGSNSGTCYVGIDLNALLRYRFSTPLQRLIRSSCWALESATLPSMNSPKRIPAWQWCSI